MKSTSDMNLILKDAQRVDVIDFMPSRTRTIERFNLDVKEL